MSQIEQDFRMFLSKNPEIEKCYAIGLINRRSLARYMVQRGVAKSNQLEASIAMLRRYSFKKQEKPEQDIFKDIKVTIKNRILILDFEKEKELVKRMQELIMNTDYDKGDTLKIVVGSSSVKVFIDQEKEDKIKELIKKFTLKGRQGNISEISLMFPEKATQSRGIVAAITKELAVHDILLIEVLTATPELLMYVDEKQVLKAYETVKRMQE